MDLVVIESPLSGDLKKNIKYAKLCMLDCLTNYGEAPYASHLLYTQCLDDGNDEQRKLGMEAGFFWGNVAEKRVVYIDLGISNGMKEGIVKAQKNGQIINYRILPPELIDRLYDKNDNIRATKGFK